MYLDSKTSLRNQPNLSVLGGSNCQEELFHRNRYQLENDPSGYEFVISHGSDLQVAHKPQLSPYVSSEDQRTDHSYSCMLIADCPLEPGLVNGVMRHYLLKEFANVRCQASVVV